MANGLISIINVFTLLFIVLTKGIIFNPKHNMKLTEVSCADLSQEVLCAHPVVNNWCIWNSDLLLCENNYNSILFLSPWDVAAMPKSVISSLILFGCMLIYWCSELILNNLSVFKRIDPDKRSKCQIYIFELIAVPMALSYLLYEGTFDAIFHPDNYAEMGPERSLSFLRSMCSSTFLLYMYAIEMLTNKLRWSLNLHHIAVIFTCLWFMALLDGSADLASIRCILAMSLYPFTESNVFIQLLLYRLYPSKFWLFHAISAALYTFTRVLITITFIVCYISWINTNEIRDQIAGNKPFDSVYVSLFFILPIATVLLNIAQIQTIKALWFMTRSVYKRQHAHERLLKDLESTYTEYAAVDSGYWSIKEWKHFISTNLNTSCQKPELCEALWDILLFDDRNYTKTNSFLTLNDFKRIFEPHIAQNIMKTTETMNLEAIKQKIVSIIEALFHILSTSKNKHTVALQVYQHIKSLIDSHQSVLDLPEELEPIHSTVSHLKQFSKDHTMEMGEVSTKKGNPEGSRVALSITVADMHGSPLPMMTPTVSRSPSASLTVTDDHEKQMTQPKVLRALSPLDEDKEKQYSLNVELELDSLNVPEPSLPIWYMNRSLTKEVSTIQREYTHNTIKKEEISISKNIKILFYGAICPLAFCAVCSFYVISGYEFNVHHLISLLVALSSTACILFYIKILTFSNNICYFEMTFKKINGVNYIPDGIVMDEGRSFDSISMLAHARGTTIHKYHTFYLTFGSGFVLMGSLIKMFDLEQNSPQQIAAVFILMMVGIGGIMLAHFEVYSSPAYSWRYNLILGYLHLFGASFYSTGGSIAFYLYSNGSIHCSIPLLFTIILLVAYKLNVIYRYKRDAEEQTDDNYIKRTNKRSKINICMELVSFIPSIASGCIVLYRFGK